MKRAVLFVVFTSVLLITYVSYCGSSSKIDSDGGQENTRSSVNLEQQATEQSTGDTNKYIRKDLELPTLKKGEYLIRHAGYSFVYNETYEQAAWIAYELTEKETEKRYDRTDKFIPDPAVSTGSATDSDYSGSGYDRGHLAPAADMGWSETTMVESFYFSNMSPQVPGFNRGIWKRLEEQVRSWAIEYDTIYVVTGPVLKGEMGSIGANKVAVPNYYYKVILDMHSKPHQAIGFVMENASASGDLSKFAVSVDSVERFTGIDFFPSLEDATENTLEKTVCTSCWTWEISRPSNSGDTKPAEGESVQCIGTTQGGSRCKRMTSDPSGRCYQHQ
jgi:endonuclease G